VIDRARAGTLAALALLLAGCGGGATASSTPDRPGATPTVPRTPAVGQPAATLSRAARAPSAAARMVCDEEIRTAVATLAAPAVPVVTSTWRAPVFTCTYRLSGRSLLVDVREAGSAKAAVADLGRLRRQARSPRTITGAAGFGLPGFETPDGVVAFAKDDKTLHIDARGLAAHTGDARQTPSQVAYQLASDILGCWTGG
jgi:hypothetical protein